MTDINATVERIKSANAVPSTDSFPNGAWSSTQLLVRIDERNETMTDTLTPVRQIDPSKPPRRGRGPLIALAVAAALILILGVVGFNLLTGDSPPDVVEPVPTTTTVAPTTTSAAPTTTTPPTTTIVSQSPLPPDTPPLAMIDALAASWNLGNVEAGWALFHPDSLSFLADSRPGIDTELWYRYATRMVITGECEVRTPPQLADLEPRVEGAQMVACVDTITSGLDPDGFVAGGTWAISVADGWIHDFFIVDFVGAASETTGLNLYRDWMLQNFPDQHATLFDQTSLTIVVDTAEAREAHREFVPFFRGDTGPRDALALPADTPLLDVVAEFTRRYDTGDIEGYEALIHPAGAPDTLGVEQASWFTAVTGMTTERTCTQVTPTQIRCDEVATSGLVPGLVVAEATSVWNGRAGWIWTIEVEEATEGDFTNPGSAPGVAEYRSWVQENEPDAFNTLFIVSINMRLDTPEVRAAHMEMVQRYLAATS